MWARQRKRERVSWLISALLKTRTFSRGLIDSTGDDITKTCSDSHNALSEYLGGKS